MKRLLIATFAIITLNACSTLVNRQTQNVTLLTPGAENAKCIIENQDMKHSAYSNQTIEILKSPHDLVVRCEAPGNRQQTVLVKREINGWVFANVANGFIPGAAYDYFSRGAFDYPEVFIVNFTSQVSRPYDLPEYHTKDLRNYNLSQPRSEYMGAGEIITDETRNKQPHNLQKIENPYGQESDLNELTEKYSPSTQGASDYKKGEEDK